MFATRPHADDPQDSFPETYILACPETAEIQYLIGYQGNRIEFFENLKPRLDAWFWRSFAKPTEGAKRVQHFHPKQRPGGQLSLLERLPTEIIEEVIDVLLSNPDEAVWAWGKQSVLCMGISSPILYPKVLSRIHRDYARVHTPSWIGRKVGFHGARSPYSSQQISAYGRQNFAFLPDPMPDWQLERSWWSSWKSVEQSEELWRHTIDHLESRNFSDMHGTQWRAIQTDISQIYLYPQNQPWVLRNLTTRQIVRSDTLTPPESITHENLLPSTRSTSRISKFWAKVTRTKSTHTRIPDIPDRDPESARQPLSLAQIFLLLTAYSSKTYFMSHLHIAYGPWNGHAFEVLTLDQHQHQIDTEHTRLIHPKHEPNDSNNNLQWCDVTPSVAADVGHLRWCIWRGEDYYCSTKGILRLKYSLAFHERYRAARCFWRDKMVQDLDVGGEEARRSRETLGEGG